MPDVDIRLLEDTLVRAQISFDDLIEAVQDADIPPDDIYTREDLNNWATENGYVKGKESIESELE